MAPSLIGSLVIQLLLAQAQLERMAHTPVVYAAEIPIEQQIQTPPAFMYDHEASVRYWANRYGVDGDKLLATINCESQFNPQAVGDNGTSFGVAQFHNPVTDWGFSIKSALDPDFATKEMARAWSKGQQRRWSCYKILFGNTDT